jgi:hypothetical protein
MTEQREVIQAIGKRVIPEQK